MKAEIQRKHLIQSLISVGLLAVAGCSTSETNPNPIPSPPQYTQVPHPIGKDLGDIQALFLDPMAPKEDSFSSTCDKEFRRLKSVTQSADEIGQGIRELVLQDPVHYHWCFYSKVLELEKDLSKDIYVDERQKHVLDTYDFLVPVAKTFASQYHDSRYLRWAVYQYKKFSQWVFYRKLQLTPEGTSELVESSNPFGIWREPAEKSTILDKYHLGKPTEQDIPKTAPTADLVTPSVMVTPVPTPTVTKPVPAPASKPAPMLKPVPSPKAKAAPAPIKR